MSQETMVEDKLPENFNALSNPETGGGSPFVGSLLLSSLLLATMACPFLMAPVMGSLFSGFAKRWWNGDKLKDILTINFDNLPSIKGEDLKGIEENSVKWFNEHVKRSEKSSREHFDRMNDIRWNGIRSNQEHIRRMNEIR